jgi:hypothetical protein
MITPRLFNQKANTPVHLLTREMFVSVGVIVWRNRVAVLTLITYPEWAMFPWNRECYNLWCLPGRQPLLEFRIPCCQETRHWRVVYSGAVSNVPVYGAWPEDRSVCPFCGAVVLGLLLGSDPLSWVVVQTEDPLWESHIPGHNVGKLTLLLYPIFLPGCK